MENVSENSLTIQSQTVRAFQSCSFVVAGCIGCPIGCYRNWPLWTICFEKYMCYSLANDSFAARSSEDLLENVTNSAQLIKFK